MFVSPPIRLTDSTFDEPPSASPRQEVIQVAIKKLFFNYPTEEG